MDREREDPTGHGLDARYGRAARLLAFAFLFVTMLSIWSNVFEPRQMDFLSFWAAAKLALVGTPAAAYDIEAHKAVQDLIAAEDSLMPFPYPPPFLLLVLPIGLLPYVVATPLWIAGTFGVYVAAVRKLVPDSAWLAAAFPPVLVNAIVGQNGFLTAALFFAGMAALPKRPFLAGLLLGSLVIKPQLGMLLPLALIAAKEWRAFAGAAFSSVGLLLLGLLLFGSGSYVAMAELMPLYASIASDGLVGWHKMTSVYASLRLVGAAGAAAWMSHLFVLCFVALIVWKVWRGAHDAGAKAAVLAAATLLASPYLYIYDTLLLILPFLWLAERRKYAGVLAALWLIPLIGLGQSWGVNNLVNLMPLVPVLLLALIARELFGGRAARPQAELAPAQ